MRVLAAGLELVAAGIVAVLWTRGYFSRALEAAQAALAAPPMLNPLNIPGSAEHLAMTGHAPGTGPLE